MDVASQNEQEKDLYVKALRALDRMGKQSDVHKVATTSRELSFMRETQRMYTRVTMSVPYKIGQYDSIFDKENKGNKNEGS